MFEEFINAYKTRYFKIFSDDFRGRFRRLQNELTEPKFHPSVELERELNKLDLFLSGPLTVATLGQFSTVGFNSRDLEADFYQIRRRARS